MSHPDLLQAAAKRLAARALAWSRPAVAIVSGKLGRASEPKLMRGAYQSAAAATL